MHDLPLHPPDLYLYIVSLHHWILFIALFIFISFFIEINLRQSDPVLLEGMFSYCPERQLANQYLRYDLEIASLS
jgi:hypothetical protein